MNLEYTYPKVAVLMATYNGSNFLAAQLASIRSQLMVNVQIIIRDDGSTDNSLEIARTAANDGARITFVEDHLGPSRLAGVNFLRILCATQLSSFDYVAFADQDDVWFPEKLAKGINSLRDAGADGYSANLLAYSDEPISAWLIRKDAPQVKLDYLFQGGSAGCTYVLSRKAAELLQASIAPLNESYPAGVSHDWIAYAVVRSHGLKWVFDPTAPLMYRQHGANQYGARGGLVGLLQRAAMVRDGWYSRHVAWLAKVVVRSPAELRVFSALASGRLRDRWWLVKNARAFRREKKAVWLLRAAIILGRLS